MLKITQADAHGETALRLEGRLTGPQVEELERHWRSLRATRVQLDLASVTFVDEAGLAMLGRLLRARVTVARASTLVRELLKPLAEEIESEDHVTPLRQAVPAANEAKLEPDPSEPTLPACEAALLQALKTGEAWAFEQFVRTHAARVKATAERYLCNEEDANDAVQETFLSAFKAIQTFEGKARLSTWLHRIAVNAALMKLRKRERKEQTYEHEIDELLPQFVGLGAHARSPRAFAELPEHGMVREETCAFVRRCIDQLPEMYRTALLLRDIEELDNEEVAEHLGITVNAAKIRVHRARQALRTLLELRFSESDA